MTETMNLAQAADLLHMHKETVRARAKAGELPGAKLGRCWVFLLEDLKDYVRGHYADMRQAVHASSIGDYEWQCADVEKCIGSTLLDPMESEYAKALGLPT